MLRKSIAAAVTVACVGLAGGALAASSGAHFNDAQYIQAARCQAIATSLGGSDVHAFDALVKSQERGRTEEAFEAAQEAHDKAARQVREAGPYEKSQLTAERDGACQALVSVAGASNGS
ncbi:MAG TPA: hypothetical protein VGH03_08745 [Caulobacteraceae bacterium]|jgi:hypothetical protein